MVCGLCSNTDSGGCAGINSNCGVEIIDRLLLAASIQTATLYSLAELAAPFALSRPTIQSYVQLLARMFLIDFLPAWHSNRLKRLLKTPKLHAGDTGWACSLLAMDAKALAKDRVILGKLTETFVVQELKRQSSWADQPPKFFHFRDKDGQEVDIVLERGARQVAGVEVKLSSSVGRGDFSGLARLRQTVGKAFVSGVVFYDGEETLSFGDRLLPYLSGGCGRPGNPPVNAKRPPLREAVCCLTNS